MDKQTLKNLRISGFKFVILGTATFALLIALIIMIYFLFVEDLVINSKEYEAASYYIANAKLLQENFLTPIEAIRYDDMVQFDKDHIGRASIIFKVQLKHNLKEKIQIEMLKFGDFWIVISAVKNPRTPREEVSVSTYSLILSFLENVEFGNYKMAESYLYYIEKELLSPFLVDFLKAKLYAIGPNQAQKELALSLLDDYTVDRMGFFKTAALYQKAKILYKLYRDQDAISVLLKLDKNFEEKLKTDPASLTFRSENKDPFLAAIEPISVLAEARLLLSQVYLANQNHSEAKKWAIRSQNLAKIIKSSVVFSQALYIKAQALYFLKENKAADLAFKQVISNVDDPDLRRKAWAFYFRGQIAAQDSRHEDSLDYFDTALNLQPTNFTIRNSVILYLIKRNFKGDLEIALGFSLRGIDYGFQKALFEDHAKKIYRLLGMTYKNRVSQ